MNLVQNVLMTTTTATTETSSSLELHLIYCKEQFSSAFLNSFVHNELFPFQFSIWLSPPLIIFFNLEYIVMASSQKKKHFFIFKKEGNASNYIIGQVKKKCKQNKMLCMLY